MSCVTQAIPWGWINDPTTSKEGGNIDPLVRIYDLCKDKNPHEMEFVSGFDRPVGRCKKCGLPLAEKPC